MIVRQILKSKGSTVVAVPAVEPISNIATLLTESRIGAVVVRDSNGRPFGILSERDIVEGLANNGASVLDATAEELMTADIVTCSPEDHIDALMQVMTDRRVRHLPVLERGRLAGIISIGDLVKARIGELETEGEALQRYIGAGA
jgi:CBS domain-containing protein